MPFETKEFLTADSTVITAIAYSKIPYSQRLCSGFEDLMGRLGTIVFRMSVNLVPRASSTLQNGGRGNTLGKAKLTALLISPFIGTDLLL